MVGATTASTRPHLAPGHPAFLTDAFLAAAYIMCSPSTYNGVPPKSLENQDLSHHEGYCENKRELMIEKHVMKKWHLGYWAKLYLREC